MGWGGNGRDLSAIRLQDFDSRAVHPSLPSVATATSPSVAVGDARSNLLDGSKPWSQPKERTE